MLKKIVLFALLLVPMVGFAQEKIAYCKDNEIIQLMPEYAQMMDSLKKTQDVFQAEYQSISDEYVKKMTALNDQQDTLSQTQKMIKMRELDRISESRETLQQQAQQTLGDLQQRLLASIIAKLRKALAEVGKENNYSYIITGNEQVLLYVSPQSPDATPAVKAKLGLSKSGVR